MLNNADVGELLWNARREATDHRRRALERASRASRFWPEEVHDLAAAGRPLTELRAVGPWIAAQIETWLEDPPPRGRRDTTRIPHLCGGAIHAGCRPVVGVAPLCRPPDAHDAQRRRGIARGYDRGRQGPRPSFVAVTDHSQSLQVANGMTPDQLAAQRGAIDTLDGAFADAGDDFRILRSMEVDVFPDGTMDMDDESLSTLDLVLGAFHSKLRSTVDETDRYLAALRQPRLHVLAHPKARMYGRRVGLVADWRRVFAEAAQLGKAVELDATVWRQDLSVSLATLARDEGVRCFSIGRDAHNELELEFLPFGMATAARAGIERDRILNYRSIDFVRSWARELNEEARIEHEA
jgi:histidinol phosphatase-like PHP family hydrolase